MATSTSDTLHIPRDYSAIGSIPYCKEPPTYDQFRALYLDPNIPVLIGPALTEHWRARQQWVVSATGKPDFKRLRDQLCQEPAEVPVADCATRDYTDQKRSTMDLKDFLDEWEARSIAGEPSRTYLKDYHFLRAFPDYGAYETPSIFRDDWMNEFWTRRTDLDDDYRFVYCGGDATFTPFHADVYRSYSWSANICGIKKWTLFPPGQEHLFRDNLRNTVYDIENVDATQFPLFHTAKRFTIYQNPGETLFVPSGWWHQVHNIGDTISINHNWCNGSNLDLILESLCSDLKEVEHEIEHLKEDMEEEEWVETCQRLLLANSGWDWSTIWQLCMTVHDRVQRQMETQATVEDEGVNPQPSTTSTREPHSLAMAPQQPHTVQESTLVTVLDPEYTAHVHSTIQASILPLKTAGGSQPIAGSASDNIAFTIDSFLSPQECRSLIEIAELGGFRKELLSLGSPDFPKSYVADYRHSLRTEVTDPAFAASLWTRISKFIPTEHFFDRQVHPSIAPAQAPHVQSAARGRSMTAVGLDPKIRFLKYEPGHQFLAHMDAEYEDEEGRLGLLTFQIYLNEDYQGGETSFMTSELESTLSPDLMAKLDADEDLMDDEIQLPPLKKIHVYAGVGKALVFQRDLIHEAARVLKGVKYVIGIDVMFRTSSS
ncbi:histone arginine demethylase JMJD6 [Entomortierella parvispora]|uniref:Histone arginine demethylase JMJD6 n=1 Tax=Entomortierella parvispora TaxID=205924 RepID=A0A9P3HJP9_9FUNG|nr:histone arginine demethylase JMJD6 [Entomortierella parvispora]